MSELPSPERHISVETHFTISSYTVALDPNGAYTNADVVKGTDSSDGDTTAAYVVPNKPSGTIVVIVFKSILLNCLMAPLFQAIDMLLGICDAEEKLRETA